MKKFLGLALAVLFNIALHPARETIHIQAQFYNKDMVYHHREALQIEVLADRDCYFKVIRIDANNEERVIFPNQEDGDNYLIANTPRLVFQRAPYMLYGPYGTETVVIAASSTQFDNKQAYSSCTGEARYNITIHPPKNSARGAPGFSFSFEKPNDMLQAVETVRNSCLSKGGTFSGDLDAGYFRVPGLVAGQYNVTTVVNVSITEKPPLIHDSLIEKEVKKFFNR